MNNKGFSVIELLIAMAIGTVLLISIVALFQKNDKTYKTQNMSNEAGQNVRTAMDMLVRELKMAGFGLTSISTPLTSNYTSGDTIYVSSTAGIVNGDTFFVCSSSAGSCESRTVTSADPQNVSFIRTSTGLSGTYSAGDKLFSIEDSRTGMGLEKILNSSYDDDGGSSLIPCGVPNTYCDNYSNNFNYVKDATEISISFIAGFEKITTNLTSSYTTGIELIVSNSDSFDADDLIIVSGGGDFDSAIVVNCMLPSSTKLCVAAELTNDYAVGSAVYKVDIITYSFDSASKTLRRGYNGGALQEVAENIEYFRFKYYDVNRNIISNPSPYTGVTLTANQRAAVRNINVQAVAITDKEDSTYASSGTYDNGTTYNDHKHRFFLESDVYLRNTIP